jgi:hypothetical protein
MKQNEELAKIDNVATSMREHYTEKATEFLAEKERQPYYLVSYEEDVEDGLEFEHLKPLNEDNVSEIKEFIDAYINKAYAEEIAQGEEIDDVWRNEVASEALVELSEKEYLCEDSRFFRPTVVTNIDLNTKHYCYRVKIAIFPNGMASEPRIICTNMNLPDDVYLYLLVEFMWNPELSLNKLRTMNQDIYERVCSYVDNFFHGCLYPCNVPTYAVEFTEIIEDAQILLKRITNNVD